MSILTRIDSTNLIFSLSRRKKRRWKSGLCLTEDLPSLWKRYHTSAVLHIHLSTAHLLALHWMTLKLPPPRLTMSRREHTGTRPAKAQRYDSIRCEYSGLVQYVRALFLPRTCGMRMVWVVSHVWNSAFPSGEITRWSSGCSRLHASEEVQGDAHLQLY